MSVPQSADGPSSTTPDTDDRPVLRASGPEEIVQIVPYLFGFHPHESAALIALRGRRVVVSVRTDLDAPVELVRPWCRAAATSGADGVIAVIYTDGVTGPPLPRLDVVDQLSDLYAEHGLNEIDVLAVSGGRWWSYRCRNRHCCPPEGKPIDRAGVIAASAVAEGLVALPGRHELQRELETDALAMKIVDAEIDKYMASRLSDPPREEREFRAEDWAEVRRFVRRMRKAPSFTPPEAARVLCALMDRSVRDAAIGFLERRPDDNLALAWQLLVRVAPVGVRPAPATLCAMWRYGQGQGARTNVAIDVALAADPHYTLALLLLEMQGEGINPADIFPEMAAQARLVGRRIQRKRHPSGRRVADARAQTESEV